MVYSNTVTTLDPVEHRSISTVLRRQLAERPDQLAVRDYEQDLTYRQLDERIRRVGGGFAALGVKAGDTVLLMLDNHVDYITTWLGLTTIGAVEVPVNTAYRGSLLSHIVNDSGAAVIVIEDSYLEQLSDIRGEIDHLHRVIVRGADSTLVEMHWTATEFGDLRLADPVLEAADSKPWDLMAIMYTSGTTGKSKGVLASHGLAYSYCALHWIEPGEVVMCNLPLFHVGGQWAGVYMALINGGTSVIVPRFSASGFWDDVYRFGCTQTLLLGAMASFLFAQPARETDRGHALRNVNMVPVLHNHEKFAQRYGVRIGTAYGMTELSSTISMPYGSAIPGGTGWVRPDFAARLVDEHDFEVPSGTVGELVLRPHDPWAMMSGYHGLPDSTIEAWRGLWFHTGDAMIKDQNGCHHFVDRRSDALRVRGENISSFEVEREIAAHPSVMACAVVAVASAHTEDDVKAVVVPIDGEELGPEELLEFLVPRLPYFMVPRYIEIAQSLPTTPTQKIRKAELRAAGVTGETWDREHAGYRVTKNGLQAPNSEPRRSQRNM
ncbi:AMP-binding protein [Rhodococcoides yunnanense]|uniref:AMP-binding protein n=1 Tax=Rhodococcoides yunnanense TaxID=278209 RepID=UPI0014756D35|nr:AMP-binding protein [Rhodococcus yunnanensis]